MDEKATNHPLDITSIEDLRALQETDPSLQSIRKAAYGHTSTAGVRFFTRKDCSIDDGCHHLVRESIS